MRNRGSKLSEPGYRYARPQNQNQHQRHRGKMLGTKITHLRPYISDNGPLNSGPMANERKKIESVMARIVGFVISGRKVAYKSHRARKIGAIHNTIFLRNIGQS